VRRQVMTAGTTPGFKDDEMLMITVGAVLGFAR
jgi:hypothetical protein